MNDQDTKRINMSTESLEFDRYNPRLVAIEGLENASDEKIMSALVSEADIGELVDSIVANRYMDIEPLIVTKDKVANPSYYRVLEGNRRLCAIRLILNPEIARQCRLSLPKYISGEVRESLKKVSAYLVENEEESLAFIGFKHINGPHRWDSYAKARFLTDWYLREYDNNITIETIAEKLGDQNQTVRSLIGGMLVLKQAEDSELFDIKDRTKTGRFGFSHLYTALGRLEYRDFLGLEKEWNHSPPPNPILKENESKLKEVLQYIYGSKQDEIKSVIRSQNPDLKYLGEILVNPIALEILRSTNELDEAREEILPAATIFEKSLIIAYSKIQEAMKKVSKFAPESSDRLLAIAFELVEMSEIIKNSMENKIGKSKESK